MIEKTIRKLAKSNKFQTIYMMAKEGSVPLFCNIGNYTNLQILLLNYLSFYNNIYTDVAMDYVIEEVLDNEIYEDAYMYYRNKSRTSDFVKNVSKAEEKRKEDKGNELNSFSWVMKKPSKK